MDNKFIDVQSFPVSKPVSKVQLSIPNFELHQIEMDVYVTMYTADERYADAKTVHIPPDVYAKWGTDDTYIVDYVMSQLKLTRATNRLAG